MTSEEQMPYDPDWSPNFTYSFAVELIQDLREKTIALLEGHKEQANTKELDEMWTIRELGLNVAREAVELVLPHRARSRFLPPIDEAHGSRYACAIRERYFMASGIARSEVAFVFSCLWFSPKLNQIRSNRKFFVLNNAAPSEVAFQRLYYDDEDHAPNATQYSKEKKPLSIPDALDLGRTLAWFAQNLPKQL